MARKKKPSSAAPMQTRRARRAVVRPAPSTPVPDAGAPSEPPSAEETEPEPIASTSQVLNDNAEEQPPQTENAALVGLAPALLPCIVPVVALHKKFGKYRLLLNDDSYARRAEVSGSDSETSSSVEIRVVDPAASSESDSNAAHDHASTHYPLSPANSTSNSQVNLDSNVSSPALSLNIPSPALLSRDNEVDNLVTESVTVCSTDPMPEESLLEESLPEEPLPEQPLETLKKVDVEPSNEDIEMQLSSLEPNAADYHFLHSFQDIPLPNENIEDRDMSDDDVITVVQIVEEDPALYDDSQMDSLAEEAASREAPDIPPDPSGRHIVSSELINNFRENFQNLNLTSRTDDSRSSLECLGGGVTIDIPSPLDRSNGLLLRPDPSITPSSTHSDDSNSSRVLSEAHQANSNDSFSETSPGGVRRSSRIKTISSLKQKTKGYGLVKTPLKKALLSQTKMKLEEMSAESSPNAFSGSTPNSPSFPVPSLDMPVKVKSRWRRSSEMEMVANSPVNSPLASPNMQARPLLSNDNSNPLPELKEESEKEEMSACDGEKEIEDRLRQFDNLDENEYRCERAVSKEAKKMTCDCFLTREEVERGEHGCGEDCLNRLLMIECNYRCPVGDRCTNRRFQKRENAALQVFYADKKGCGLEAAVDLTAGEFLMEYVGEVLNSDQFYQRAQEYSDANNLHHYFMSLKGDSVIDATMKGNISRFINHSCEPNAETQKWTVNGELRIGFFSKRDIPRGEEITFDYQFQRFGKVAQRCYCGANNCRGWIGAEPDSDDEEDEDEEEDDVSTSKTEAEAKDPSKEDASEEAGAAPQVVAEGKDAIKAVKEKKKRPRKPKNYAIRPKSELEQDADIEDDLEALARTGIKNQSHTLTLSRTMVRAKTRKSQAALLRLLREADLPCRRLFLDYRGLRLLAPWCSNSTLDFRLEVLQTLDRLPVPNKTMVQESRLFTVVERWLAEANSPDSVAAANDTPDLFIDEATGLPVDIPMPRQPEPTGAADKQKDSPAVRLKVSALSKQLLERWSSLKEVFKIPKKERIQQMKEHERQANVERRAADSSGSRERERHAGREHAREERERERSDREREREREREKERERERERHREREREREKDRDREREKDRDRERDDRDRRKRRGSPDGRRSIRLEERVLAAIPPVSKEERRRAFAEAAAAAEQSRQQAPPAAPPPAWPQYPGWPGPDAFPHQMFPPGMMGAPPGMIPPGMMPPGMMPPGMMPPGMMGVMGPPGEMPAEWVGPNGEYVGPPQGFGPVAFGGPSPFCMPQHNFMGMAGYPVGYVYPTPGAPPPAFPAPPAALTQPPPGAADVMPEKPPAPVDERWKGLLPSGWRSAKDPRGRVYYYHVKERVPQWVPPTPPPPPSDDEGSSEEEELSPLETAIVRGCDSRQGRVVEGLHGIYEVIKEEPTHNGLIPESALLHCKPRKRRPGLVSERPISPRSEEDKLAGKMEVKRYRETKEKLRRRKERLLQQRVRMLQQRDRAWRRHGRDTPPSVKIEVEESSSEEEPEEPASAEVTPAEVTPAEVTPEPEEPPPEEPPFAADPEESARRLKEVFRGSMARVMVQHLNNYRKRDATHARITNTADFKHLARKLTHFVMLKELKHCRSVDELECNDSVKSKAKEFVRKYMAKFGPVYQRPAEEMD